MSVLVGTLAVDVTTNQASFTLDAAKSQLDGFGKSAKRAGSMASYSMREARESVSAAGEAFGVHLPSAISRTIAGMESLGPILAAALPFAAIAVGAVFLFEHITKAREAAEKMAETGRKLTLAFGDALGGWKDKILQTREQVAELNGNELEALHDKLILIDHADLKELRGSFDKLSVDVLKDFQSMETGFWSFHNLMTGDTGWGTKEAVERLNALQEAMDGATSTAAAHQSAVQSLANAQGRLNELNKQASTTYTPGTKEAIKVYGELIPRLQQYVELTKEAQEANKEEKGLAVRKYDDKQVIHVKPPDWKAYQESVNKRKEAEERLAEDQIKANEAFTKAMQAENKKREKSAQELAEYQAEQTALGKKQKASEGIDSLDNQYKLGLISVQQYVNGKKALLEQEKQAELNYLDLRKTVAQQNLDEANTSGDESARLTALKQLAESTKALSLAQTEYNHKLTDMGTQIARDTTMMGAFDAALKQNQTLGAQFGQNWARALEGTNQAFAKSVVEGKNFGRAMRQVGAEVLESMLKQLLMSEELAIKKMLMDKLVTTSHLASNAETTASDKTTGAVSQLAAAKAAAAKAWSAMASIPYVGPVLGAVAAATTFAGAMAFEDGGIVPGYGTGDTVPAMLTPGEMVLPKPISQSLQSAGSGNSGGSVHWHAPSFQPKVTAMDAEGVDKVLTKHATTFERKYKSEMRRRGR